jgi:cobalamin biosynthesis protein CobD/CbiB
MNKEYYIIIGACVFAFLIGQRLKKKLKKVPEPRQYRGKAVKKTRKTTHPPKSKQKEKIKRIFTWAMLVLVFGLLIFMIPALSRDLLSNTEGITENLVLRILIVAFSLYILVMGYIKLNKKS